MAAHLDKILFTRLCCGSKVGDRRIDVLMASAFCILKMSGPSAS